MLKFQQSQHLPVTVRVSTNSCVITLPFKSVLNDALPVTVKMSSIVVVPPAESIVKSPDDVSISLLPVTPICTLSIVAPPLASIAPVNVERPDTLIESNTV